MLSPIGLTILMYHSISDNPKDPHAVPPKTFRRQVERLVSSGTHVVKLEDAARRLRTSIMRAVVLTFDDGYRDFLQNVAPVLTEFRLPGTLFVPTGLVGKTSIWDTHDKSKPLMTWDEIAEASRLGFQIGSHTVSHLRLTECSDKELDCELRHSLAALRARLNSVVPILSYPSGFAGRREREAARNAGYVCAVGVSRRIPNGPWSDPYNLGRLRWP
jgi:peptidoglycan/xylan/chitin deacetylase (PgdA/CDA1 family)